MKDIFIATNNPNKVIEFKDILKKNHLDCNVLTPRDFDIFDEPVEDGLSFKENAYIKAKFYYDIVHLPTLADDSGLCIDCFGGFPGIYSSRFLKNYNYEFKNNYIVNSMKNETNRKARFVCNLCYIDSKGNVNHFEGINEGEIASEVSGFEGFGYDPIFLIPKYNKTEAELGDDFKNVYSHRAKAFKMWLDYEKK